RNVPVEDQKSSERCCIPFRKGGKLWSSTASNVFWRDGEVGEHHGRARCARSSWLPLAQRAFAMSKKIYVGNLPWSTTSATLESLFSAHGAVNAAEVIADRETGRSRGFGFVEMESDDACQRAIQALNGTEVDGRAITVNEARE